MGNDRENGPKVGQPLGWPHRIAKWPAMTFGPASEEPYGRRVTDWVMLVLAAAVLTGLAFHSGYPTQIEIDVFRLINGLPSALSSTFRGFSAAGTLWAVGLVVTSALAGRRLRLARDLLLAGLAAWALGRFTGALVAGNGFSASLRAVSHVRGTSPEFPVGRVGIVAAVVETAAPYLTRPVRRAGRAFVLFSALSALYFAEGLPNGVLGGIFLGLVVAAGVHLVFGSPGGRPTSAQVTAALAELGVHASDLHLSPKQPFAETVMAGRDEEGPIMVRVLGRDEADAQFLSKFWHFLVYKGPSPALYLTRLQEVEHSAYLTIVARDHGVRTSEVVVAGQAGPKTALLVERPVQGRVMANMDAAAISDDVLVDLWHQVGRLRAARLSHGDLDAAHVVVGPDGPAIVGFGAPSMLSSTNRDGDVLSLLVATAVRVGAGRAVDVLARGLGTEVLPSVLPLLQPAALSHHLQSLTHRRKLKAVLEDLRAAGAQAAGVPAPSLHQVHRVSGKSLVLAVGLLLAVIALLGKVSNPTDLWRAVQEADWTWVAIAFVFSIATNLPNALALMGTVPRKLPFLASAELELSTSFTNLAVPSLGAIASQVRFLQKQGVELASAVAAGGLVSTAANAVVNLLMFGLSAGLSPHSFHFGSVPIGGVLPVVLGVIVAAGVAAAVVFGVPRLRKAVVPPVRQATSTVVTVMRSPKQILLLAGGFAGVNIVSTLCLLACLKAFGASMSFWTLLAVLVGVSTASALVPIPGGGSALSAVGISGLLTGFGVRPQVAVAAVLTRQVVVSYLPAVLGWFATRHLIRRDEL